VHYAINELIIVLYLSSCFESTEIIFSRGFAQDPTVGAYDIPQIS